MQMWLLQVAYCLKIPFVLIDAFHITFPSDMHFQIFQSLCEHFTVQVQRIPYYTNTLLSENVKSKERHLTKITVHHLRY